MAADPIIWMTSSRTPDGYGDEARAFLRSAESLGLSPGLIDLSFWSEQRAGLSRAEEMQLLRQESRVDNLDPEAAIYVHHYVPGMPLQKMAKQQGLNVSRSMFETDRIPGSWLPSLSLMDEIWVPTNFNIDTFAASGVPRSKIRKLGGTLDFDFYDPDRPDLQPLEVPGLDQDHFVFLSNFDFTERKGWQSLLKAWRLAFSEEDRVTLLLKTASLSVGKDEISERINAFWGNEAKGAAPVVLFNQMLSVEEMAQLYYTVDAFVLPSRGEGWGRPYMEALAMGLPTVASNFSAHLEFVRADYAWLVDGSMTPVPPGVVANGLYDGHMWFEPDVEDLAGALREIYDRPDEAKQKAGAARAAVISEFGPQVIAERIAELSADLKERRKAFTYNQPRPLAIRGFTFEEAMPALALSLQGELEASTGGRYKMTSKALSEQTAGLSGITFPFPAPGGEEYLVLWEDGKTKLEDLSSGASEHIDLLLAADPLRAKVLVEMGLPAPRVSLVPRLDWEMGFGQDFSALAHSGAQALAESGIFEAPPVASLKKVSIEGRREKVLWAPDLGNPDWRLALEGWLRRGDLCDDKTLALWLDHCQQGALDALDVIGEELPEITGADIVFLENADLDECAFSADFFLKDGFAPQLLPLVSRLAPQLSLL